MSLATNEADLLPPDNVLVDEMADIRPSPLDAEVNTETTPLLSAREHTARPAKAKPWYRKAAPAWVMVPGFVGAFLTGCTASVEMEVLNQVACRAVAPAEIAPLPVPTMPTPGSLTSQLSQETSSAQEVDSFVAEALSKRDFAFAPRPYRHIWGIRIAEPVDEDWNVRCRKSPAVQKKTTEFMTKLMMIGGLTSSATTGYWGALSDARGRVPLIGVANFGKLAGAIGMVALVSYPEYLGENFAMIGMAASGLLGGDLFEAISIQAYLQDLVLGSRAGIFSLNDALQFIGIALGPVLGGLAYEWTGLLLIPYYGTVILRTIFLLLLLFVVPESLSKDRQREQRRRVKEQASESGFVLLREEDEWRRTGQSVILQRTLRTIKKPLQLLEPLAVLLPRKLDEMAEEDRPLLAPRRSKSGRDWSLTLVACAFSLYMVVPGLTPVKVVYARGQWGWGPAETGAWITFSAVSRVVMLLGILPVITRFLRKTPPSPPNRRPADEEGQIRWDKEAARLKLLSDSSFDLTLVRYSILVTLFAYLVMIVPHQSLNRFLFSTFCIGLSSAATPAIQSLALAFSSPRAAGKTLAALSVLCNLAVQLVGPPIFGAVYVWSVDWYPEMIFGAAALYILASFLPTLGISLKDDKLDEEAHED